MKGKNMQRFEGKTDKSLSVFGMERAKKQINVLRMYKSMKTVMNKPQSVISKYSFIAQIMYLDKCVSEHGFDISPLTNDLLNIEGISEDQKKEILTKFRSIPNYLT